MRPFAMLSSLFCLVLISCAGPFYFPKSYIPKRTFPNLSRIEIVSRSVSPSKEMATLKGTVVDIDGQPIIGAYVMIQGAVKNAVAGAATDINGSFDVSLPPCKQPLSIQVWVEDFYAAILNDIPCSNGEATTFKVTLSQSGEWTPHGCGESLINQRSTSSGATIENMDESTGVPSVHPH